MGNQHYYSIPRHCTILNLHNIVADKTIDDFGSHLNKILLSPVGKGIRVIDLTKNLFDDKQIFYILPLLSKNFHNVEELYLNHNELSDSSLSAITKFLSSAKVLKVLNLDDNLFTREAVNVLRNNVNIDESSKLDYISLERNSVGHFSEEYLVKCGSLEEKHCIQIKISQYHHSGNQLKDVTGMNSLPLVESLNTILLSVNSEPDVKFSSKCGSAHSHESILNILDTIQSDDNHRELSENDIDDIISHFGVKDGRLALRCMCQILVTSAKTNSRIFDEGDEELAVLNDNDFAEDLQQLNSAANVTSLYLLNFCASKFDQPLTTEMISYDVSTDESKADWEEEL